MSNFTASHAIVAMFFEMANADGQVDKSELEKIGELSRKYIAAQDSDFDEVVSESIDWYFDQSDVEKRINFIFRFAATITEIYGKNIRILIAKDLVKVAQSDGEIHEREGQFFRACLELMGLNKEDLE